MDAVPEGVDYCCVVDCFDFAGWDDLDGKEGKGKVGALFVWGVGVA